MARGAAGRRARSGAVVSRAQILAYRRHAQSLDARMPAGAASVRRAAWAGLQDSMPRAALISMHARVDGVGPAALADRGLVQTWGPRYNAYVVAVEDVAVFTLGRLPSQGVRRSRALEVAARLAEVLGDEERPMGETARALGMHPGNLRYAAAAGTVLIRWDGARQPTVRIRPAPTMDAADARSELARRHLRVFGPSTAAAFAEWAGVTAADAAAAFESIRDELVPVRTPIGDAWLLAADEAALRAEAEPAPGARLLPSGDAFFLLFGPERDVLVPDRELQPRLWTSRVWPGVLLLDGEINGTWRRSGAVLDIEAWRTLSPAERELVEAEAASLPLPGMDGPRTIRWTG